MIASFADLFALTEDDLVPLERMGKKSAQNVVRAIDAARGRPLDRFLFGLGIRYVGERTAQILARRFGTLQAVREAKREDFEAIGEIGQVIAQSLERFFADPRQNELIDRCLELGVQPQAVEGAAGGEGPLQGKTVVITGTLSVPRNTWKQRLEEAGAHVTGSVSGSTDYVLVGAEPGSKYDKAQKLGVETVDEEQMQGILEGA